MPENPVLRVLRKSVGCAVLVLSQCLKFPNLWVNFWTGWKIQVQTTKHIIYSLLDFISKRNTCPPLAKPRTFPELFAGGPTLHLLLSEISTYAQAVFVFSSVVASFQCCSVADLCFQICCALYRDEGAPTRPLFTAIVKSLFVFVLPTVPFMREVQVNTTITLDMYSSLHC